MDRCLKTFPGVNRRLYDIVAFDWDGTAVPDRKADAIAAVEAVSELLALGVKVVIITGTNFDNIDRQFSSRISGHHKANLYVCANRGSEVFGFSAGGESRVIYRRKATSEENRLLDAVAETVKREIESRSDVSVEIVYDRLNRRKIDLIPDWPDPPKSRIAELVEKTEARLTAGGLETGVAGAFGLASESARKLGLDDARVTSDVKHIEVGLTDKSDSVRWLIEKLAGKRYLPASRVLVGGDEFGPVAGFPGSDFHMVSDRYPGITYVSVGKEPSGVPPGVLHMGGGPDCFVELLREQAAVRRQHEPTADPAFRLEEKGFNPLREREIESLFTTSNGYLGTRASLEEQSDISDPATLIAGLYDWGDDGMEELVIMPEWHYTTIEIFGQELRLYNNNAADHVRILDMEKAVLYRHWNHVDPDGRATSVSFLRFVSMADMHTLYMRISLKPHNYSGRIRIATGFKPCLSCRLPLRPRFSGRSHDTLLWSGETNNSGITVAMAQKTMLRQQLGNVSRADIADGAAGSFERWDLPAHPGTEIVLEKYVSVVTSRHVEDPVAAAIDRVNGAAEAGETALLLDHAAAWRKRWRCCHLSLDDNLEANRWLNFAGYHLNSAGKPGDERVSISARALTGTIYRGHIFWDTEIFILPFLIFTWPQAARALLMYRYHLLPQARQNALETGYRGANFPWESAGSGREMTPRAALNAAGEVVPVLSGELEEHITAAVAHGVCSYIDATGDTEFMLQAGAELVIEAARFWASLVVGENGSYHILNVEGPDEYHEGVDDNFYTNAMAAWNICRALEMVDLLTTEYPAKWAELSAALAIAPAELDHMREIESKMYLDMGADGKLIEQFRGYFQLEDINVSDYEPRTAPLDVILGREKAAATQLVKQADVVMALYLLEQKFTKEVINQNFEYYDPRTAHGSSLSPSIYGLVAARLGKMETALRYFRKAAQIDLADNMGNASGGVHLAALGGLWQQMVMGFAGVRAWRDGLYLWPDLPAEWQGLEFNLMFRGVKLEISIRNNESITVVVEGDGSAPVGILHMPAQQLEAGEEYVAVAVSGGWTQFNPKRTAQDE